MYQIKYLIFVFLTCIKTISAQVVVNQSKCFGGSDIDYGSGYCLTSDGGYLICGCARSSDGDVGASIAGSDDLWIVKLNSTLNIQSSYLYGGSERDCALNIMEYSPNLVIVTGTTNSPDWPANGLSGYADDDLFVMAIDSSGNELWSRRLGGSNYDRYPEMIKTRDGKILISGMTNSANNEAASSHGRQDGLLVKVDTNGTVIWSKCIGTIGNDYFNNIYEANNGDLLLAGLIGSELWAVRCDSIGNVLWQGSYGGSNVEEAYSITELGSGIKIALRDLEVRGAGNLLGAEQHGQMNVIGYELYCRMLDEEIKRLRDSGDTEFTPPVISTVEIDIDSYIPSKYIEDEESRMNAYRRISAIGSKADYDEFINDIVDRYGEPPKQVTVLASVSLVRSLAGKAHFEKVAVREVGVFLYFAKDRKVDMKAVSAIVASDGFAGKIMINAQGKAYMHYKPSVQTREKTLQDTVRLLKIMLDEASSEVS